MKNKFRNRQFTENQRKIAAVIAFIAFLAFCAVVTWFIGRPMIQFVSRPEKFRAWVDGHGIIGRLAFIGMMFFQVVIAFVPGEPLEIGAGYAFGAIEGTILCVMGITLGSLLTFMLVRKLGVRFIEIFFTYDKIKSLKFLQNEKKLGLIIFLIFFIPGTPKDMMTYFVGLTDMKISHYLLLVSAARLPSVITSTVGGDALGGENYLTAIIVFVVTALLSGAGLVGYKLYLRHKEKRNKGE